MLKNLSKGEMTFRVMMGVLIIVALYVPLVSRWLLWVLAAVLVLSGIMKYCPVCQIVDKPKIEGGV